MDKQTFSCTYPFGRQFNETTGELTIEHPVFQLHAGSLSGSLLQEFQSLTTDQSLDEDTRERFKGFLDDALGENKQYASIARLNAKDNAFHTKNNLYRFEFFTDAREYQRYLNLWYKPIENPLNAQEMIDQSLFHWMYNPEKMLRDNEEILLMNPIPGFAYQQVEFTKGLQDSEFTDIVIDDEYDDNQIPLSLNLVFLTSDQRYTGKTINLCRNSLDWLEDHLKDAKLHECFHIVPVGVLSDEDADHYHMIRTDDRESIQRFTDKVIDNLQMPLGFELISITFIGLRDIDLSISTYPPLMAPRYYSAEYNSEDHED